MALYPLVKFRRTKLSRVLMGTIRRLVPITVRVMPRNMVRSVLVGRGKLIPPVTG